MLLRKLLLAAIFLLASFGARAQSCPENIGFEDGTFNHWTCYAGYIGADGEPFIQRSAPILGRHTMVRNQSPQGRDPFGNFPINCPNGSGYSIILGNSTGGSQAEGVSYDYTIPADQQNFTLIYYYAVVMQNPGHTPDQQPQFRATLTDITTDQTIIDGSPQSYKSDLACANHKFVASDDLTGFHTSVLDPGTLYKTWTPVAIHLVGYAGHTIRMAFITNDCAPGKHFGYAYLDFNETCFAGYTGPIVGSNHCDGTVDTITLTAPPGFTGYKWYNESFTTVLGEDDVLQISPTPPNGTRYALVVTPPADLGCTDTLFTTVKNVSEPFMMNVVQSLTGCKANGVDLTQPAITDGSETAMRFEYFTDVNTQFYVPDPKRVTDAGTYYIRGTNASGCTAVMPIDIQLADGPVLNITSPPPVCKPATVDITAPGIVSIQEPGVQLSYYSDYAAQTPIANPAAIAKSGYYYVKGVNPLAPGSCPTIEIINVVINDLPIIRSGDIRACAPVDLNTILDPEDRVGSTLFFYTDAGLTQPVTDPAHVDLDGAYYYKAVGRTGCENGVATINVTAYKIPNFTVINPLPVVYPLTVDVSFTHVPLTYAEFTYWKNPAATIPLNDYHHISESGTYYIKATNEGGCSIIHPINIVVNEPPEAGIVVSNTITPNGDGINDEFRPVIQGMARINYLRIFNRYGQLVFETQQLYNRWNGTRNGKPEPTGTYYWVFSSYDEYRKRTIVKAGWVAVIR